MIILHCFWDTYHMDLSESCLSTRTSPGITLFSDKTCSHTSAIPWVLVTPIQPYLEVFPHFELSGSKQPNVQFVKKRERRHQNTVLGAHSVIWWKWENSAWRPHKIFQNSKCCCLTTDSHMSKYNMLPPSNTERWEFCYAQGIWRMCYVHTAGINLTKIVKPQGSKYETSSHLTLNCRTLFYYFISPYAITIPQLTALNMI